MNIMQLTNEADFFRNVIHAALGELPCKRIGISAVSLGGVKKIILILMVAHEKKRKRCRHPVSVV